MFGIFKKALFSVTFNLSLFLILIIGMQNSSNFRKINFIVNDTVNLPISFIVGMSFISGSLVGSLLSISYKNIKK